MSDHPKFKFTFSGFRSFDEPRKSYTFICPVCKVELQVANVRCITCSNCGAGGSLEDFSAVRKAA